MKSETKNKNIFARMAVMLIALMLTSATVQATTYIKDVMLIGGSESEVNSLKTTYQDQGWTVINQNLNAGCRSSSDHIYLLCKYDTSNGANFGYISDLYISTSSGTAPDTRTVNNRTFYLVTYDGGSHFEEKKGDLNSNAGGDDIHLYYTRTPATSNTFLSSISFTTTKNSGSGALGSGNDGWGTGYDLNSGAGGDYIYLHATTATATTYTVTIEPGIGLISNEPPSSRSSDNPTYIAASKSAAQNLQFYNDNGSIGFYLSEYYDPFSSNQKDGYTFLGWNFDSSEGAYHALTATHTTYTAQRYGWLHDGATITGVECSDFSKNTVTYTTIPATIDGTEITGINITYNNTIADNLPRLQSLSMPTVGNVSGTPFKDCAYLTDIHITNISHTSVSFDDLSVAYLPNQLTVWCYNATMPEDFHYQVYQCSPGVMFVFKGGDYCGWCGDDSGVDRLCWTMKNQEITIYCCDDSYKDPIFAPYQIVNSHPWSRVYALLPEKVYLTSAVKGIGAETFKNNSNLAELYYEGTKAEWDAVTKGTDWKSGVASNFKEYWRCTVAFDTNGRGTAPQAQTELWRDQNRAVKPSVATNDGYELAGWYIDADCATRWDFNTIVTADTTLYAKWGEPIHNSSDNDLTAWDDEMRDVTLDGRTLYCDNSWNTLCLPFSLNSLAGTPLEGFTVMELDTETEHKGHMTGLDNGTLYLNFKKATSIQAGKPYIVKKAAPAFSYNLISAPRDELDWVGNEKPENMFDGDDNTRWVIDKYDATKPWVVVFNTSIPILTIGYTIVPKENSDPYIWTLQAKLNESDEWITIDSQDKYDFIRTDYYYSAYFSIAPSKQGYYKYFRLEIATGIFEEEVIISELSIQNHELITSPLFYDVIITSDAPTPVTSADGTLSFVGSYSPINLAANDVTKLYLGASNTLYYPSVAKKIGACRAIFSVAPGTANLARACVLNFIDEEEGEEEATEIRGVTTYGSSRTVKESGNTWYDLNGSELRNKPAKSGIYINNGKKIAIK